MTENVGPLVGTVTVTCPACGDGVAVPVTVASLTINRSYTHVTFDAQSIEHPCNGRMN